ncbi:MAG: T9SS type A sorting domain-containing protein [Bacteroidota bacterium]|nr:T9SS type A sorting domain-containing protein [Bacteroidota bacterium]
MKICIVIILLVVYSLCGLAQDVGILDNQDGRSSTFYLKMPDTTYTQQFNIGQVPEHLTFDDKYMLSTKQMFDRGSFDQRSMMIDNLDSIDPGILPEGDLPYKIKYTADGERLITICHHSNNVYVYDVDTKETLAIINVGLGPEDMVVREHQLYVCCYYSDQVYVINLDDYSISLIMRVEQHPCLIRVNSDENLIYVGCHTTEHKGGFLAAYNLNSQTKLWSNTWPHIDQINMSRGYKGRKVYTYAEFLLINDDNYIACQKQGSRWLIILDAFTGDIIKEFDYHYFAMVCTPGADTLYTASVGPNNESMRYFCINTNTLEILDSIIAPTTPSPISWYWQGNLVIDATGRKLFIEMGGMDWNPMGLLADFNSHEQKIFDTVLWDPCYFPTVSYDKRYVISNRDGYQAVFDFEAEEYIQYGWIGSIFNGCKVVESSPDSYEFAWHDHHAYTHATRWLKTERINFWDFSDPTNIVLIDSIICGEQEEADLPFTCVLNSKHNKIITANTFSKNISIINATTHEIDTFIPVSRITNVTNITDDLITLSGIDNERFYLFDLNTLSIIKEFRVSAMYQAFDVKVIPSPDQQYFYTYNRADDNLIKYSIDGSNSAKVDSLYVEDYSVFYLNWESRYYPEISPDGLHIFIQGENEMQIIHTGRMDVECMVPTPTYHLFDMAFTPDSKRVCLAHGFGRNYFSVIYINGPDSYLEHTIQTGTYGGMGVAYNLIDQKFYLPNATDIYVADPVSGLIEDTIFLTAKNYLMQIGIDPFGNPVAQSLRYLYYNGQEYYLRECCEPFTVYNETYQCFIPRPGPDNVFVLDFLTAEISELPTSQTDECIHIYPNPTNDRITIKSNKLINHIEIFSSGGELLFSKEFNNAMTTLSLAGYTNGIYFVRIKVGGKEVTRKVVKQ